MATVSYRVDDLDGKSKVTGDSTVLSLDGNTVSIDLSDKHREELTALLSVYFDKGVAVTSRKASAKSDTDKDRNTEIRAWRQAQNRDDIPAVADRGRIPLAVVEAYETEVEGHATVAALEAALTAGESVNA